MVELNQIYCGNSAEVMKEIPDSSVDIVVCSPPYNFGRPYADTHDGYNWPEYYARMGAIWEQCQRVLVKGGRLCINIQPRLQHKEPIHRKFTTQLLGMGMLWLDEIIWEKNNSALFMLNGKPHPAEPMLRYTWEYIDIYCKEAYNKPSRKKFGEPGAGSSGVDITEEEFKKWAHAKWTIAPENQMSTKFDHPAMFPKELPKRLMKMYSYVGDVVLDPFNGCGTTTLVAKRLKRRYIGIDLSEQYCQTAKERMESDEGIDIACEPVKEDEVSNG